MISGDVLYDQITKATVTRNIKDKVTDGHETTPNLLGKHTIPGGQRTILIDARLQLECFFSLLFFAGFSLRYA
jgi:hypothetical protein